MPDLIFADEPTRAQEPLSDAVRCAVDVTIDRLARKEFEADPVVDPRNGRITSIVSSAYKRHGKIIETSLRAALEQHGLKTWTEPRFKISAAADQLAHDDSCLEASLPYGDQKRSIQLDLVVVQVADWLGAYECKRGFGYHDSGKQRSMLRDLRCVRMLLRSYGELTLGVRVKRVDARLISYYGKRSLPHRWSLSGHELDEHFGVDVTTTIKAGNRYFGVRLQELLESL